MIAFLGNLRRVWAGVAALVAPIGVFGCGTAAPPAPPPSAHAVGSNDPAWMVNRPNLPPPDTDRIDYDARTRTLTFYQLPGNDRWVVQLPGETEGHPVTLRHRLPDADLTEVMVYYTRPGVHPSVAVSVQQIQESSGDRVSSMAR